MARNQAIFHDTPHHWPSSAAHILSIYHFIPDDPPPPCPRIITPEIIDHSYPWAYFDGSAQSHGCGGGFILHLSNHYNYKVKIGLGHGTNNFAELSCLLCLLQFSITKDIHALRLFGDSTIVIDWFSDLSTCHTHTLQNILAETLLLKTQFDHISCRHIFRGRNTISDLLSKEATHL